jgi:uncharacterized membrane protein YphA (DoxX/SURF4 family)
VPDNGAVTRASSGTMSVAVTEAPARQRFRAVQPWLSTVVRLGLAAVWLTAGFQKARDPQATVLAVRAYRIVPELGVHTFAYALPWVELAIGLLLVLGFRTRLLGILSAMMLLMFMGGIMSVWARGYSIDCGCFGGGGNTASGSARYLPELARDTGFLAMAAWLIAFPRSWLAFDPFVLPDDLAVEE